MTSTNDHDRRLAAWLDDGPSRASDRMIDHALAHARTHPRRRDPLASLRKDPMSSNTFPAVGRPITLLAAAALVVVAVFAAATVGGVFKGQPAVVPPVASPSASPTVTPVVSPSEPSPIAVNLIETVGGDATATVTDSTGTLVGAVSGQPGEGMSVEFGTTRIERLVGDPNTIVLTWSDFPCTVDYQVRVDPAGPAISITRPACTSDAIGVDRVLHLTFDGSLDPTTFVVTFTPG
jgi:hypothetical protein